MKKILSILAVAAFIVSISSCAKIYDCKCEGDWGKYDYEIAASNKKEAKLGCEEANKDSDETCTLQ